MIDGLERLKEACNYPGQNGESGEGRVGEERFMEGWMDKWVALSIYFPVVP